MIYDDLLSEEVRTLVNRIGDPPVVSMITDPSYLDDEENVSIAIDVRIMSALFDRIEALENKVAKLERGRGL